uniref:BTB domain-containing protein n=1 Tax=Physcomitrium patens TaxID=3218 RepID=A0A7I4FL19_PHYPA
MAHDRVHLNVGGKHFVTSRTTLANAGRGSMLAAVIDENWQLVPDAASNELFIDRNPAYFTVLLDLLRTGELHVPPGMLEKPLYREAEYYGILDHVKAARKGPLNGNRLDCVASISGRATGDGTAIRASPDGGCCVAHGSMVVHDGESKNFTAGALASSDKHVYASCRGRSYEYGVGTWDQITGQQASFLYEGPGRPLGDACKMQWLPRTNLLLVANLFPSSDHSFITLLDSRTKGKVWSWTDAALRGTADEKIVMDTVAMEECSTVCVVNQFDNLGFIDMRANNQCVRWSYRYQPSKISEAEERFYSKLACSGSQLFSSKNDSVYVFCSPDWDAAKGVQTARLRRKEGGAISDISVGGDRLFVLHNEEDVFDVWETPGSSQIVDIY